MQKKDINTIGGALRHERLALGLTQEQLALKVGRTQACISMYESGVRLPKPDTLQSICLGLGDGAFERILTYYKNKN